MRMRELLPCAAPSTTMGLSARTDEAVIGQSAPGLEGALSRILAGLVNSAEAKG